MSQKKTLIIFKLVKKNNKNSKIIFSSSGSVYGPCFKKKKFSENTKINSEIYKFYKNYKKKYTNKKIYLEKKFYSLSIEGFKISIARCYSFYGEKISDYNFFMSKIINSVKNKKNILLQSKSKLIRGYMHEHDLARWLVKICKNSSTECPIFNVGSDQEIDLVNFSKKIALKNNLKVYFKTSAKGKTDYYVPEVKKAKKLLKLYNTKKFNTNIESLLK